MTKYLVCATPRTGGHLLDAILKGAGLPGAEEHLFRMFADKRLWTIENLDVPMVDGVWGCRYVGLIGRFSKLEEMLCHITGLTYGVHRPLNLLRASLGQRLKFIHLTRRNLIRQAISWDMCGQTKSFVRYPGDPIPDLPKPVYRAYAISAAISMLARQKQVWVDLFDEWVDDPLEIVYEDMCEDMLGTAQRVVEYLGLPPREIVFKEQDFPIKLAGERSEAFYNRYMTEGEGVVPEGD